jgi:hypothetical protein
MHHLHHRPTDDTSTIPSGGVKQKYLLKQSSPLRREGGCEWFSEMCTGSRAKVAVCSI